MNTEAWRAESDVSLSEKQKDLIATRHYEILPSSSANTSSTVGT